MNNAKNLLAFIISTGEAIDKATADKKIDISDAPLLMEPMLKAGSLGKVKEAMAEFKNADHAQRQELVDFVEQDLDLRSDRTEELIQDVFEIGLRLWSIVEAIRK